MRAAGALGPFFALVAAVGSLSVGMSAAPGAFLPELRALAAWAEEVAPTAAVSGRVSLDGRPLPYTRVELHGGGKAHAAYTGADGSFRAEDLPAGDYEVSVHPPVDLPPNDAAAAGPDGPPPLDVPARYRQAATSGLRLHLPPGATRQSVELRR
jgi:Carboxypeptidase regulatory-like domain